MRSPRPSRERGRVRVVFWRIDTVAVKPLTSILSPSVRGEATKVLTPERHDRQDSSIRVQH